MPGGVIGGARVSLGGSSRVLFGPWELCGAPWGLPNRFVVYTFGFSKASEDRWRAINLLKAGSGAAPEQQKVHHMGDLAVPLSS